MTTPAITSNKLPLEQRPSTLPSASPPPQNEAFISDDQIEAKPLRPPNFINLRPKNRNLSLFWGNRAVGEKESGLRYDQLISMGFIPAKPEDILTMEGKECPPSIQREGKVMFGDLILLKIARTDYIGALKWNEQTARQRVKKPGTYIEGAGKSNDIGGRSVIDTDGGRRSPSSALTGMHHKISTYVPSLTEANALTSDNSGPTPGDQGKPLGS